MPFKTFIWLHFVKQVILFIWLHFVTQVLLFIWLNFVKQVLLFFFVCVNAIVKFVKHEPKFTKEFVLIVVSEGKQKNW